MDILISLPGLFIAIIFHELAHGYTAYKLGDSTAKDAGRLTVNPLKHIDPLGFVFMLVFKFGWAKPVPINPSNFINRKRDTILVSISGPLANYTIALLTGLIITLLPIGNVYVFEILLITLWYNIMLGTFNLLPFPPLDGSKIVASLLPIKLEYFFYKYERYLYIILLILVATDSISKVLGPIIDIVLNVLIRLIS